MSTRALVAAIVVALLAAACGPGRVASVGRTRGPSAAPPSPAAAVSPSPTASPTPSPSPTPDPAGVYAAATGTAVPASMAAIPARVYVPNSGDGTVSVIDPRTFTVVDHYAVGRIPHHITPAWDLSTLYVDLEGEDRLAVIDPATGKLAGSVTVPHPYNLYFTPDGSKAIVTSERLGKVEFYDRATWRHLGTVTVPYAGVDHMDFSADGTYLLASTEYSGVVVKIDTVAMRLVASLTVGGLPIDVRLAPDGSVFYVANQGRMGVSVIDPVAMKELAFLPTGKGAHGFALSRDARSLYVSDRLDGTIAVIDFATRRVTATWKVGGSPDMLAVSPDGRQLWTSDRFGGTVRVIDTGSGAVLHVIPVGVQPHGLTYFPNVGRLSIGHNGVYR